MPQSARLAALAFCFIAILYVGWSAIDVATTEQLDDPTIRNVYKQADALIKNPQGMHDFLLKRLHDGYKRKGSMINSAQGKDDQTTPVTMDKTQTVNMTTQTLTMMKIDKYVHKIVEIQFTDDQKYAYVSSTEVSTGTINFPVPGTTKKVSLPFNEAGSCIDTLMQYKKILMIVASECTNKMAFLQ